LPPSRPSGARHGPVSYRRRGEAMNVLDELTNAVGVVCDADPAQLADREAIQALHRQLERVDAATTRSTSAFEAAGTWEADGARAAAAWVATRCRVPVTAARRRLRLGRALRHMADAEAAWLAGDIDAARVAALADARTPVSAACFERDETLLVEQAARLSHRQFARALAYWLQRAAAARATPPQRRADAAVEMARRARAVPPGARLPEPLFTVFVGYETFAGRICELADGTVVAPGSLVGWLEDGWVERVVFDGPD